MKNFRKFFAATVLTLALAFSTFAGEIGFPGVTATGDMSAPGITALDPVTEAALSLLQSLLSLF